MKRWNASVWENKTKLVTLEQKSDGAKGRAKAIPHGVWVGERLGSLMRVEGHLTLPFLCLLLWKHPPTVSHGASVLGDRSGSFLSGMSENNHYVHFPGTMKRQ